MQMKNYIFQINNSHQVVTASYDEQTAYSDLKRHYPNDLVFLVKVI